MKSKFIILCLSHLLFTRSMNAQDTSVVWFKSYGGYESDYASSVIETYDGGYLVVGVSWSFVTVPSPFGEEPRPVIWLLKTDLNGDTLWTTIFNNYNNNNIVDAFAAKQAKDSGFVIVGSIIGSSDKQVLLVKTNSNGAIMWTKIFGVQGDESGTDLLLTPVNGYLLLCNFLNSSGPGVWIIKTNIYGDTLWTKKFLGYRGKSVKQTFDNGFIVSGHQQQVNKSWLMKVDSLGNMEWQRTYSSPCSFDLGNSFELTPDNGYIFVGANTICRTEPNGDTLWWKNLRECVWDDLFSVTKTNSDNFIAVGRTNPAHTRSKFWIVKFNISGDILWEVEFGDGWDGFGRDVMQSSDGCYVIVGREEIPYTGNTDLTIMKIYDDEIYNIREPFLHPELLLLYQNYPNPFNPSTKIKYTIPTSPSNPSPYQGEGKRERFITLKVYDVLGNEIATLVNEEKPAGEYEVEFTVGQEFLPVQPSGIYFYQLRAGQYVETKKMVLLK